MIDETPAPGVEPFGRLLHVHEQLPVGPVAEQSVQLGQQDQSFLELDVLLDAVLRRGHGLPFLYDSFQRRDERRQIACHRVPKQILVDDVVTMSKPVAHPDDLGPGDIRLRLPCDVRDTIGRLAHNLHQARQRHCSTRWSRKVSRLVSLSSSTASRA